MLLPESALLGSHLFGGVTRLPASGVELDQPVGVDLEPSPLHRAAHPFGVFAQQHRVEHRAIVPVGPDQPAALTENGTSSTLFSRFCSPSPATSVITRT